MAAPTVTNSFTNGAVTDASAVNQNFNDIISALTDGTKDLAVATLGVATLTISGSATVPTLTGTIIRTGIGSAGTPSLSYSSDTDTGLYFDGSNNLLVSCGGTLRATFGSSALTMTIPVYAAAGSVSAPSVTHSADTNTGMYFGASDDLYLATGGAQALKIDSNRLFTFAAAGNSQQHVMYGRYLDLQTSNAGAAGLLITNATNSSGAHAYIELIPGGTSGGDPYIRFSTAQAWACGPDNSDSDKFKISANSTLGTFDYLSISGAGAVQLGTETTSYLELRNQADPGAITDGVRIGSVDLSAGNATLSLRTERAVAVDVALASTHSISVQINGTTYKIPLST